MMLKINKAFSILLVLLVSACGGEKDKVPPEVAGEAFSLTYLVYDASISKMFGLNERKSMALADGLRAVGVEFEQRDSRHQCRVNLYLDSSLDIYSPNGGADYVSKTPAERAVMVELSDAEAMANSRRESRAQLKLLYRTVSLLDSENGLVESPVIDLFKREAFTGISLLSYVTSCSMLRNEFGKVEWYIQKNIAPDTYSVGNESPTGKIRLDYNYRLSVPEKLLQGIQTQIDRIVKENMSRPAVIFKPENVNIISGCSSQNC